MRCLRLPKDPARVHERPCHTRRNHTCAASHASASARVPTIGESLPDPPPTAPKCAPNLPPLHDSHPPPYLVQSQRCTVACSRSRHPTSTSPLPSRTGSVMDIHADGEWVGVCVHIMTGMKGIYLNFCVRSILGTRAWTNSLRAAPGDRVRRGPSCRYAGVRESLPCMQGSSDRSAEHCIASHVRSPQANLTALSRSHRLCTTKELYGQVCAQIFPHPRAFDGMLARAPGSQPMLYSDLYVSLKHLNRNLHLIYD